MRGNLMWNPSERKLSRTPAGGVWGNNFPKERLLHFNFNQYLTRAKENAPNTNQIESAVEKVDGLEKQKWKIEKNCLPFMWKTWC